MNKTIVVKLGGSTLGGHKGTASPDTTLQDLLQLTGEGTHVVLVHGGGSATSELVKKMGGQTRFHNGLRVTDATALQAATMMMRGQINTDLVQSFNRAVLANSPASGKTVLALGMSGVDGRMLESRRETAHGDIGFVGEIVKVNVAPLAMALEWGYMPIIAPIGFSVEEGAETFNLNADTAAAFIASALEADACVFLTDVPGVLDAHKKTLRRLGVRDTQRLIDEGVITGGMIPKIAAALKALEGSKRVMILDGRQPGALYDAVERFLPNGTTFARRALMEIDLSNRSFSAGEPSMQIALAPTDPDIIAPVYYQSYHGTIDDDWDNAQAAYAELRRVMTNNEWGRYVPEHSLVALDGDQIMGACQVTMQRRSGESEEVPYLCSIYLLPQYRGMGFGKVLVQQCLDSLQAAGFKRARLFVTVGNEVAQRLYRSLGFEEIEVA